jgi:SRSO17 transposase
MFDQLMGRVAGRFARVEPRRRATALVLGLLSDLPRKNCWTLAEHAGDATPDGMQHLLHRAKWDADAIRDDIRAYVIEHLADDQAVLVVDETGEGTATVGVQRQYTGTASRIENAQVAVYLVYSAARGHAAIDRLAQENEAVWLWRRALQGTARPEECDALLTQADRYGLVSGAQGCRPPAGSRRPTPCAGCRGRGCRRRV